MAYEGQEFSRWVKFESAYGVDDFYVDILCYMGEEDEPDVGFRYMTDEPGRHFTPLVPYPISRRRRALCALNPADMYKEVCHVEANLTHSDQDEAYDEETGKSYTETEFGVVLTVGMTELKARITYFKKFYVRTLALVLVKC